MYKAKVVASIVLVWLIISIVSLKFVPHPYLILFPLGAIALLTLSAGTRFSAINLAIVGAGVFVALFLAEVVAMVLQLNSSLEVVRRSEPRTIYLADKLLGSRMAPNGTLFTRATYKGRVIYDVVMRFDKNGFRVVPDVPTARSAPAIAFFGDSFTQGANVNDNETMPWNFAELAGEAFRIYNFGIGGKGPHQMLAMLESGRVEEWLDGHRPAFVVYQALIPQHIERMAGYAVFDQTGPKYVLRDDGAVAYVGQFHSPAYKVLLEQILKSHLLNELIVKSRPKPTAQDVQTYVALVKQVRKTVKDKWGAKFFVLVWNRSYTEFDRALFPRVLPMLAEADPRVYNVSNILPGYDIDPHAYLLEKDDHPTPQTHRLIAEWLFKQIASEYRLTP